MVSNPLTQKIKSAPILLGAFFCLLLPACSKKKSTADWENHGNELAAATEKPSTEPEKTPETPDEPQGTTAEKETRFLAYNLKNYLTMRRYINGEAIYTSKPEEEISALIQIIQRAAPDVLGVCEIGTRADLKDLQTRLKKAGLDLPYSHRVHGSDETRALAILSRYPIIATAKPKKLSYSLNKQPFHISRGILDATIQLPTRKVRFLGAHLKSKRPIKDADQELMRRNESLLLRKHIKHILTTSPNTNLLVYGDFNDTKRTQSIYTIRGRSHDPHRMEMIELTDSRGEKWTHNWKREDIYSRFDFVMTNLRLTPYINRKKSRVLDPKNWELASDHRALLVIIK